MHGDARIWLIAAAVACGPSPAPTTVPAPKPQDPPPDQVQSILTSLVVVEECPESRKIDSKLANREIQELVGPCTKIPGGMAHFTATLQPGGRVEISSPTGDPGDGMVPMCLLQKEKQLKHRLRLRSSCKFDVKLEQRGDEVSPPPGAP